MRGTQPIELGETPLGGKSVTNPYLIGNYAPLLAEYTVEEPLEMEGSIPPELVGMLVRNGPNPALVSDPSFYHWFAGDGMVHAVTFKDGQALSYRNRFVRTRKLASEIGSPRVKGPDEPIYGPANTHVIWHAGRLLALCESGYPHLLSLRLDTLRVEDFDAMLASPMTAHPHIDPQTGGLVFFGYDLFGPPYLRYHELNRHGELIYTAAIEIEEATMMHDFAMTATRVIFMDFPVTFDMELAVQGIQMPFRWKEDKMSRIGVLPRFSKGTEILWIETDPCYVFHVMNAFDDEDSVVVDVVRYDSMFDIGQGGFLGSSLPKLERWRIVLGDDQTTKRSLDRIEVTQLDDAAVEFPRIDDSFAGLPYRFGYGVAMSRQHNKESYDALLRYDLVRDEVVRWNPGVAHNPSEPIFIRGEGGRSDDEGWILTWVYDATRGASDVMVLDASRFGADPEAVIHLPTRVPFGFHGSWVPADR